MALIPGDAVEVYAVGHGWVRGVVATSETTEDKCYLDVTLDGGRETCLTLPDDGSRLRRAGPHDAAAGAPPVGPEDGGAAGQVSGYPGYPPQQMMQMMSDGRLYPMSMHGFPPQQPGPEYQGNPGMYMPPQGHMPQQMMGGGPQHVQRQSPQQMGAQPLSPGQALAQAQHSQAPVASDPHPPEAMGQPQQQLSPAQQLAAAQHSMSPGQLQHEQHMPPQPMTPAQQLAAAQQPQQMQPMMSQQGFPGHMQQSPMGQQQQHMDNGQQGYGQSPMGQQWGYGGGPPPGAMWHPAFGNMQMMPGMRPMGYSQPPPQWVGAAPGQQASAAPEPLPGTGYPHPPVVAATAPQANPGVYIYPCPVCNRSCKTKAGLEKHLRATCGSKLSEGALPEVTPIFVPLGDWECEWCHAGPDENKGFAEGPSGVMSLCNKCSGYWKAGLPGIPIRGADDMFACQGCDQKFKSARGLGNHWKICQSEVKWSCEWCGETKGRRGAGPSGQATLCSVCAARFKAGFTTQVKVNPETNKFSCESCNVSFETPRSLIAHQRYCSGGTWSCHWCGAKEGESLKGKGPGPAGPSTLCSLCASRYRSGYKKPPTINAEGRFVCDDCGFAFESVRGLGSHVRGCTGGSWRCEWCAIDEKAARGKSPGPNGPRTLCARCGARFRNGQKTRIEQDALGRFICDVCHKTFDTLIRLSGHKRFCLDHSRVWRCEWCGTEEGGAKGSGPNGHRTLCGTCSSRFRSGHTAPPAQDQDGKFFCEECEKRFDTISGLGSHRRFCTREVANPKKMELVDDLTLGGGFAALPDPEEQPQLPHDQIGDALQVWCALSFLAKCRGLERPIEWEPFVELLAGEPVAAARSPVLHQLHTFLVEVLYDDLYRETRGFVAGARVYDGRVLNGYTWQELLRQLLQLFAAERHDKGDVGEMLEYGSCADMLGTSEYEELTTRQRLDLLLFCTNLSARTHLARDFMEKNMAQIGKAKTAKRAEYTAARKKIYQATKSVPAENAAKKIKLDPGGVTSPLPTLDGQPRPNGGEEGPAGTPNVGSAGSGGAGEAAPEFPAPDAPANGLATHDAAGGVAEAMETDGGPPTEAPRESPVSGERDPALGGAQLDGTPPIAMAVDGSPAVGTLQHNPWDALNKDDSAASMGGDPTRMLSGASYGSASALPDLSAPAATKRKRGQAMSGDERQTRRKAEATAREDINFRFQEVNDDLMSFRREPLGYDRNYNSYWVLEGSYDRVWVQELSGTATERWTVIKTAEELERLLESLHKQGERESVLRANIVDRKKRFTDAMTKKDGGKEGEGNGVKAEPDTNGDKPADAKNGEGAVGHPSTAATDEEGGGGGGGGAAAVETENGSHSGTTSNGAMEVEVKVEGKAADEAAPESTSNAMEVEAEAATPAAPAPSATPESDVTTRSRKRSTADADLSKEEAGEAGGGEGAEAADEVAVKTADPICMTNAVKCILEEQGAADWRCDFCQEAFSDDGSQRHCQICHSTFEVKGMSDKKYEAHVAACEHAVAKGDSPWLTDPDEKIPYSLMCIKSELLDMNDALTPKSLKDWNAELRVRWMMDVKIARTASELEECLLELISVVDVKWLDEKWRPWVELRDYVKTKAKRAAGKAPPREKDREREQRENTTTVVVGEKAAAPTAEDESEKAADGDVKVFEDEEDGTEMDTDAKDSDSRDVLEFVYAPKEESDPLPDDINEFYTPSPSPPPIEDPATEAAASPSGDPAAEGAPTTAEPDTAATVAAAEGATEPGGAEEAVAGQDNVGDESTAPATEPAEPAGPSAMEVADPVPTEADPATSTSPPAPAAAAPNGDGNNEDPPPPVPLPLMDHPEIQPALMLEEEDEAAPGTSEGAATATAAGESQHGSVGLSDTVSSMEQDTQSVPLSLGDSQGGSMSMSYPSSAGDPGASPVPIMAAGDAMAMGGSQTSMHYGHPSSMAPGNHLSPEMHHGYPPMGTFSPPGYGGPGGGPFGAGPSRFESGGSGGSGGHHLGPHAMYRSPPPRPAPKPRVARPRYRSNYGAFGPVFKRPPPDAAWTPGMPTNSGPCMLWLSLFDAAASYGQLCKPKNTKRKGEGSAVTNTVLERPVTRPPKQNKQKKEKH